MKSEVPRKTLISHIASKDCPCYKCENRHIGCHSDCEKYSDWNKKAIAVKKKYNIAIIKERMVNEYEIKEKIKRSKKTKQHYV